MSALIIDGHPNPESFCAGIARTYAEAYAATGAPARLLAVRDLEFDVHMRYGYTKRMPIEPDLADARAAIREASHLVVVTPVWWRSTPALLKGFLDRALLPKEDFRYNEQDRPEGLLTGRSGRVIATADTPATLSYLLPDSRLKQLRNGTLGFCGIKPLAFTFLGSVKNSTPERRQQWLDDLAETARQDARRSRGNAAKGAPASVGVTA